MYAKAQVLRRVLRADYDHALSQYDVLAMPTTPMKAHKHDPSSDTAGVLSHAWDMLGNTAPFNMTGHPGISIPCAKSNGLPVGLMLVGRHFDDARLLQAAHAFDAQFSEQLLAPISELMHETLASCGVVLICACT